MALPNDPIPGEPPLTGNSPEDWTRIALSGSKTASRPTNGEIADFQQGVIAEIHAEHPCLLEIQNLEALPAYRQWVGYATAIFMRQGGWKPLGSGPAAGSGLLKLEVQSGDVTEKYSMLSPAALAEETAAWGAIIVRAKERIPCVAAKAPANGLTVGLAALSGRRRGSLRC